MNEGDRRNNKDPSTSQSLQDDFADSDSGGGDVEDDDVDVDVDVDVDDDQAAAMLLQRLAAQFGDLDVHGMMVGLGKGDGVGVGVDGGDCGAGAFAVTDCKFTDTGQEVEVQPEVQEVVVAVHDGAVAVPSSSNNDRNTASTAGNTEMTEPNVTLTPRPAALLAGGTAVSAAAAAVLSTSSLTHNNNVHSSSATPHASSYASSFHSSASCSSSSPDEEEDEDDDDDDDDDVEPTPEEIAAWQAAQHAKGRLKEKERKQKLLLQQQQHHSSGDDTSSSNPIFRHRQQLLLLMQQQQHQRQRGNDTSEQQQQAGGRDDAITTLLTGVVDSKLTSPPPPSSFVLQHCYETPEQRKSLNSFMKRLVNQDPVVLDTTRHNNLDHDHGNSEPPWKLLMTSLENGLSFESLWHTLEGYAGPLLVFMNVVSRHSNIDVSTTTSSSSSTSVIGFMTTSTWHESPIDGKTKTPLYFGGLQCPPYFTTYDHNNNNNNNVVGRRNDGDGDGDGCIGGDGDNNNNNTDTATTKSPSCMLFGWNPTSNNNNDGGGGGETSFIHPRQQQRRHQQENNEGSGNLMYCYHPKQRHHHHHHHNHDHSRHHHHSSSSSSSSSLMNRITHGIGIGGTGSCYQMPRLHITPTLTDCTCGTYDTLMEPGDILLPPTNFPCYKFDILDVEVWGVGGTKWIEFALGEQMKFRSRRQATHRRTMKAGAKAIYSDHQNFFYGVLE